MISRSHTTQGSGLVLSMVTVAILAALGAVALQAVQNHYRHSHQIAAWEEALLAAESGVDLAVTELRRTLYHPGTAWKQGWTQPVTLEDANATVDVHDGPVYAMSVLPNRQTEGGSHAFATVRVDAPSFLIDSRDMQWYRIRVSGYADVPGGSVTVSTREDRALRKIDFLRDRDTQQDLLSPRAKRTIEAVVKPVTAFSQALFALSTIDMNNHNIEVDSYDSRDPRYSTDGEYDPDKRTQNGDIATNGKVIEAGSAHIYGDASTNGGTVLNADNVTGEIYDDFYQESFNVQRPVFTPEPFSPNTVTSTTVVHAKAGEPANFQFSTINLSGPHSLKIKGAADGSTTYAQIVVTGDISLSGQAQITIDPGVKVRIFVAGNADISGNGFLNENSPLNLQLYGLDRPKNADGSTPPLGTMKIAGNGGFKGTVYAPNYDVEMVGGGTDDSIFGAFVGHNIRMTGVQSVHYDEALAEAGLVSDYRVVSWFEDTQGLAQ